MRVLLVNAKGVFFGGVEQNVADTAQGLRGLGHECHLGYTSNDGRDASRYQALFDSASCMEGDVTEAFESLCGRLKPDLVYFHKLPVLPTRGASVPWVRMVHDHDLVCPRRHKYTAFAQRICHKPVGLRCWLDLAFMERGPGGYRWVSIPARNAEMRRNRSLSAIIVASTFMRDELVANGFAPARIHILPPISPWDSLPTPPLTTEPHVLYVGQLIHGKGVDLLLDAIAHTPASARLRIVGDGNARPALEEKVRRLGLAARVEFLGWVAHDRLPEMYAWARVVAVPSRWAEPFGMIGIEAMRNARPVVAFAVGGIPDWCRDGETGLLAPEQDCRAYAKALERALFEPALAERLGSGAAGVCRLEFTFTQYIHRLESLLKSVQGERDELRR